MASLLKDIKAERPKITEKDNVRLLYVTKWFLEFFLCERARQAEGAKWKFGYVAEVTDRGWIVWVLRRMRDAQEEKVRPLARASVDAPDGLCISPSSGTSSRRVSSASRSSCSSSKR